jgi:preprotein translocase subunit SecA
VVYSLRERILRREEMNELINEIVGDTVEEIILSRVDEKLPTAEWEVEGIIKEINRVFFMSIDAQPFLAQQERASKELAQVLFDSLR